MSTLKTVAIFIGSTLFSIILFVAWWKFFQVLDYIEEHYLLWWLLPVAFVLIGLDTLFKRRGKKA